MNQAKSSVAHITIESIMTTNVETFMLTTTIAEAIDTLIDKEISGAPIVDQLQRVISVVTEVDLMQFAALGDLKKTIGDYQNKLVKTENLVTAMKQDYFPVAFKKFLINPIRRLIVVDGTGKLQGIVARRDMLRTFLKEKTTVKS